MSPPSVSPEPDAGRGKRRIRAPKRFDDEDVPSARSKGHPAFPKDAPLDAIAVRRPMKGGDVATSLLKKEVFVLWPEDQTWYRAEVRKVKVKDRCADLYYSDTQEVESVDLQELMDKKEIMVLEMRLPPVELEEGESYVSSPPSVSEADDTAADPVQNATTIKTDSTPHRQAQEDEDDEDEMPLISLASKSHVVEPDMPPSSALESSSAMKAKDGITTEECSPSVSFGAESLVERAHEAVENVNVIAEPPTVATFDHDPPSQTHAKDCPPSSTSDTSPKIAENAASRARGVDEYIQAEEWSKSVLASLVGPSAKGPDQKSDDPLSLPGSPTAAAVADKASSQGHVVSRQNSLAGGPSSVREKVTAALQEFLLKAVSELEDGQDVHEYTKLANSLGAEIEEQLFSLYGDVGKEYRAKYRSLQFNLKDPQNPQLRGRVLMQHLSPSSLVRMSAIELASKELSEWRTKKAAEFEKAVILDVSTAAKYSTAAAEEEQKLKLKRGELEVLGHSTTIDLPEPTREDEDARKIVHRQLERFSNDGVSDTIMDGEGSKPSILSPEPATPSGRSKIFDIFTGEADAGVIHATYTAEESMDAYSAEGMSGSPNGHEEDMDLDGPLSPPPTRHDDDDASARSRSPSYSPSLSASPEPELEGFESLIAESENPPENADLTWEGTLNVPGLGSMIVGIHQLAGTGDLAFLMPQQGDVEIKGRVGIDKLQLFFTELKSSRSRTVTVGSVSCAAADPSLMMELVKQYTSKNRAGVAEPIKGGEVYFIPRTLLTARLCFTARQSLPVEHRMAVPSNIDSDELLCVYIHRKDWKAPDGGKKRPKVTSAGDKLQSYKRSRTREVDDHEFSPPPDTPPESPKAKESSATSESLAIPSFLTALLNPGKGSNMASVLTAQKPIDNAGQSSYKPPASVPESGAESQQIAPLSTSNKPNMEPAPAALPTGLNLDNLGALAAALGMKLSSSSSLPPPSSSAPAPPLQLGPEQPQSANSSLPPYSPAATMYHHQPSNGMHLHLAPPQFSQPPQSQLFAPSPPIPSLVPQSNHPQQYGMPTTAPPAYLQHPPVPPPGQPSFPPTSGVSTRDPNPQPPPWQTQRSGPPQPSSSASFQAPTAIAPPPMPPSVAPQMAANFGSQQGMENATQQWRPPPPHAPPPPRPPSQRPHPQHQGMAMPPGGLAPAAYMPGMPSQPRPPSAPLSGSMQGIFPPGGQSAPRPQQQQQQQPFPAPPPAPPSSSGAMQGGFGGTLPPPPMGARGGRHGGGAPGRGRGGRDGFGRGRGRGFDGRDGGPARAPSTGGGWGWGRK